LTWYIFYYISVAVIKVWMSVVSDGPPTQLCSYESWNPRNAVKFGFICCIKRKTLKWPKVLINIVTIVLASDRQSYSKQVKSSQ